LDATNTGSIRGYFPSSAAVDLLSSAMNNGNSRQRVQMKSVDNCSYGAFTANGVPFGRPFANHDPIFLKFAQAPPRRAPTPRSRPTPAPCPTPRWEIAQC